MQVITCQNTGMLSYTTVKVMKLQFASLLYNVGAGHTGLPYRFTVPSLCSSRVFQGEWDVLERVWNRHEEMIVLLKVKIKFFKDIQTGKHIGISYLHHGTLR